MFLLFQQIFRVATFGLFQPKIKLNDWVLIINQINQFEFESKISSDLQDAYIWDLQSQIDEINNRFLMTQAMLLVVSRKHAQLYNNFNLERMNKAAIVIQQFWRRSTSGLDNGDEESKSKGCGHTSPDITAIEMWDLRNQIIENQNRFSMSRAMLLNVSRKHIRLYANFNIRRMIRAAKIIQHVWREYRAGLTIVGKKSAKTIAQSSSPYFDAIERLLSPNTGESLTSHQSVRIQNHPQLDAAISVVLRHLGLKRVTTKLKHPINWFGSKLSLLPDGSGWSFTVARDYDEASLVPGDPRFILAVCREASGLPLGTWQVAESKTSKGGYHIKRLNKPCDMGRLLISILKIDGTAPSIVQFKKVAIQTPELQHQINAGNDSLSTEGLTIHKPKETVIPPILDEPPPSIAVYKEMGCTPITHPSLFGAGVDDHIIQIQDPMLISPPIESSSSLEQRPLTNTANTPKPKVCTDCGVTFPSKAKFQAHIGFVDGILGCLDR